MSFEFILMTVMMFFGEKKNTISIQYLSINRSNFEIHLVWHNKKKLNKVNGLANNNQPMKIVLTKLKNKTKARKKTTGRSMATYLIV